MSLLSLVVGCFGQAVLGCVSFVVVAFSAGGVANTGEVGELEMKPLSASLFAMPGFSLATILGLVALYVRESKYLSHWWHAVPIVGLALYIGFALSLNRT